MARWRKIDVRLWGDEKFRELSRIQPCAQGLWLYLLTGPHTTAIPGLSCAGEAGMAEALGWPLEAFREAFREAFGKGMAKADWKARVIYIPNAIKHNEPESPNVVIGWAKAADDIPECELKRQALVEIYDYLKGLGEAFPKAFLKAFGEPSRKAMPNQEQEQEQDYPPTPLQGEESMAAPDPEAGFTTFWNTYPLGRRGSERIARREWCAAGCHAIASPILAALKSAIASDRWRQHSGRYVPKASKWLAERQWESHAARSVSVQARDRAAEDRRARDEAEQNRISAEQKAADEFFASLPGPERERLWAKVIAEFPVLKGRSMSNASSRLHIYAARDNHDAH